MPKTYRRRVFDVEAVQFSSETVEEIRKWFEEKGETARLGYDKANNKLIIGMDSGEAVLNPGDYVIFGPAQEFYPCRGDVFQNSYDPVEP